MPIGPHVFGDNRRGIIVIDPRNFQRRKAKIKELGITDVFLPRNVVDGNGVLLYTTTKTDFQIVRNAELYPALWVAPEPGSTSMAFAARTLQDISDLMPTGGAVELNIEMADDKLYAFIDNTVRLIRIKRRLLRMRINIAPFKAKFLPLDRILADPQLFVCEQAYFGNMDGIASVDDVRRDFIDNGIPVDKGAICFAGACESPESSIIGRSPTLPAISIRQMRKGQIFQDDLLAEVGVLPA